MLANQLSLGKLSIGLMQWFSSTLFVLRAFSVFLSVLLILHCPDIEG